MKFCKDCKWYGPDGPCGPDSSLDLADCLHPDNMSPSLVTGRDMPKNMCKVERGTTYGDPKCGPTGKNWEAK